MNFSVCPFSPTGSEEPNESILLNNIEKRQAAAIKMKKLKWYETTKHCKVVVIVLALKWPWSDHVAMLVVVIFSSFPIVWPMTMVLTMHTFTLLPPQESIYYYPYIINIKLVPKYAAKTYFTTRLLRCKLTIW